MRDEEVQRLPIVADNLSGSSKEIQNKRNVKFVYIATFFFFLFSFLDLDVFLLTIPDIKEALVSEGVVKMSPFSGKRGRSLIITTTNGQLVLNCWINSRRDKTCIKKQDNILYLNKHAKVWWYKARINGFFEENRMLQLEIDGQVVVDYKEQKEKYLLSKDNHDYLPTVIFMIFFLLSLSIHINRNSNAYRGDIEK